MTTFALHHEGLVNLCFLAEPWIQVDDALAIVEQVEV
jgi:hypothetical protein